jgi:hypothetical protein
MNTCNVEIVEVVEYELGNEDDNLKTVDNRSITKLFSLLRRNNPNKVSNTVPRTGSKLVN